MYTFTQLENTTRCKAKVIFHNNDEEFNKNYEEFIIIA